MPDSAPVSAAALADFANRLTKSARHWSRWARKQGVEAFRIYDRDLPQFPLAIDVYGPRVHLAEYDTGWQQSDEAHAAWVAAVRSVVAQTLGLDEAALAFKLRRRQKGDFQYGRTGHHSADFVVEEFGRRFWVNLDTYLDTGLFLDHRNTRRRLGDEAAGKRVLNLFAYTGSFSVYAATGGARESVTVDLSNTYLDWAGRNFDLNGIDHARHTRVRADVLRYLEEALARRESFDIIVMDPPSFSNSAKMQSELDVQRDHALLVQQCLALRAPGGVLYFSCNLRGFSLEATLAAQCADLSARSVPEDFRNRKIHQCFRFPA